MALVAVDHQQYEFQEQAIPYAEYFAGMITPDYVNSLTAPTQEFLCPMNANIYDMDFTSFKIRALLEGCEKVLFQRSQPAGLPPPSQRTQDDSARFIRYNFNQEVLNQRAVGTTLTFTNGGYESHNFRMIERHYFRDVLLRTFDSTMPFVIPNTTNTWEFMYDLPELNDDWKAALIAHPWESRSDSFFFVNDQLVMHQKAEYNYGVAVKQRRPTLMD